MKSKAFAIVILINATVFLHCFSQDSLSVLFLGNSYSSSNNLPLLVKNLSVAAGKRLTTDAYMPGGYTISGHLNNATSLSKIKQGGWNYIVIQEQSQIPTINHYRDSSMYPSLTALKDTIKLYNPCAKIITYMTWGRRFGGMQCDATGTYCSPAFIDFNHMQDSLTSAYMGISELLQIQCAPVGVVWKNILNDTSLILHVSDNSHPNLDGSYVAACTIFSSIWKLPSYGLSTVAGLTEDRARYYQFMADKTVFEGTDDWNLLVYQPLADFSYQTDGAILSFTNLSTANDSVAYHWDFGDNNYSNEADPIHTFTYPGNYTVSLIASKCNNADTVQKIIEVAVIDSAKSIFSIYPNPASNQVQIIWKGNQPKKVQIINAVGQLVKDHPAIQTNDVILVSDLPSGIYFFKIYDDVGHSIKKVSIQH